MTITRQMLLDASWIFVAGTVLFGLLALWARRGPGDPRRPLMAGGACAAITAAMVLAAFTVAPDIPAPAVPFTARFQRDPLPATPQHIEAGRTLYQANCAVCHGPRGLGDGPAAFTLTPRPANLQVHMPLHAEGEIFHWISNGVPGTAMPVWKDKLDDTQRWQIIRYLETLAPR